MEAIREIRTVEQGEITLRLPKIFWGRKVEIIILSAPVPDKARSKKRSLRGCLQSYARPELIATESAAWLEAVEDKHAKLCALLDDRLISVEKTEALRQALSVYCTKNLDIVDALLWAYHNVEHHQVMTFDEKLSKLLEME